MVQQLASEEEFNAAISDKNFKATIVDFTATWCGPCQMIKVNIIIMKTIKLAFFSTIIFVHSRYSKNCQELTQTLDLLK